MLKRLKKLLNKKKDNCDIESEESNIKTDELVILHYLNGLKQVGIVDNILVNIRSSKDIDIIITVPDNKVTITLINLESDFYLKKSLNIDLINRSHGRLMVLTKEGIAYEIKIVGNEEYKH